MKNILVLTSIGLLGLVAYGRNKAKKVENIASNLKFQMHKINKVGFSGNAMNLNLDLKLTNNTDSSFNVSTGNFITLNKLEFFNRNGDKVAEANKIISNITLTPFGVTIIENVDVSVELNKIGAVAYDMIMSQPNTLKTKANINIFGQSVTI